MIYSKEIDLDIYDELEEFLELDFRDDVNKVKIVKKILKLARDFAFENSISGEYIKLLKGEIE